jgi:hypothetical protein
MMKETGAPRENHWPAESQWQTVSHDVVSPERELELTMLLVIGTDCIGSCTSNYHTIMTTTAPLLLYNNHSL